MKNIRAKLVSLNTRESLSEFEICIGVYVLSLVPPSRHSSAGDSGGKVWVEKVKEESGFLLDSYNGSMVSVP